MEEAKRASYIPMRGRKAGYIPMRGRKAGYIPMRGRKAEEDDMFASPFMDTDRAAALLDLLQQKRGGRGTFVGLRGKKLLVFPLPGYSFEKRPYMIPMRGRRRIDDLEANRQEAEPVDVVQPQRDQVPVVTPPALESQDG